MMRIRNWFWACLLLVPPSLAGAQTGPLPNMNMEAPEAEGRLPEWWAPPPTTPYRIVRDTDRPFEGAASARIESTEAMTNSTQFGTIARGIDATPYRGKRVRLRGAVRTDIAGTGWAGLWMRVDRVGGLGFFDNMQDRPIRTTAWQTFEIVGDVAPDAKGVTFGLILGGGGKAWLDDVSLTVIGDAQTVGAVDSHTLRSVFASAGPPRAAAAAGDVAARPFSGRGLANVTALARGYGYLAHFDATDQAAGADWPAIAIRAVEQVEPTRDATTLARALNASLRPYAPDFCAYVARQQPACVALRPEGPAGALAWRHQGREISTDSPYKSERIHVDTIAPDRILTVDLGGGVLARVPLAAWVGVNGKTIAPAVDPAPASSKPAGWTPAGFDRSTRLADTIVAWNLFQHFYPYFDVVKVDWPAVLERSLVTAATDPDDMAFQRTLARMINALEDGHGNVMYALPPRGHLPVAWEWVEGRLVVTAVAAAGADGLRPGDVVERIGEKPISRRLAETMTVFSGSEQWRRTRALDLLIHGVPSQALTLGWSRGGEAGVANLTFGEQFDEARPAQMSEVRPGIYYVDLSRASPEQFDAAADRLAAAKGIIFDVRGYPSGTPSFLSHLSGTPFQSMPMNLPVITRPDRQGWTWDERHWDMPPQAPRYGGKAVFLTDERAISYAESVLQTVKGAKLGTIVGSATAGANGNINPLPLPGGYVLVWTGMQVLNSDRSVHHNVGVIPDIVVGRTIAGIRAGRDEVLEKGIQIVDQSI